MEKMSSTIVAGVACTIIGSFATSLFTLDGRVIAVETKMTNGAEVLKNIDNHLKAIEGSVGDLQRDVNDLKTDAAVRKALQLELKHDIDEIQKERQ